MSTRSRIGMLNEDGSVTSIYCHFDGYPDGVGATLRRHWREENVRALLALGNLSVLGETIGERQNFDAPTEGWCLAYGRDRGEEDCKARTHAKDEWPDSWQEFEYLWTGREWRYRTSHDPRWRAIRAEEER